MKIILFKTYYFFFKKNYFLWILKAFFQINEVFSVIFIPICPGVFLSDHAPGGEGHIVPPPPGLNLDSKMLFT